MDFIKEYIEEYMEENSSKLFNILSNSGFTEEQVYLFFPEAASQIVAVLKKSSVEKVISQLVFVGDDELLNSIDFKEMSEKLKMSHEKLFAGFEQILPVITIMLTQKENILSSLIGESTYDIFTSVEKLYVK